MDLVTLLGVIGTLGGIVAVIFSLVTASRNNARWGGIVDHKINNVIEGLNDVKNRLTKLEDDRGDMRRELVAISASVTSLEKSVERAHARIDKINGGRDRHLDQ